MNGNGILAIEKSISCTQMPDAKKQKEKRRKKKEKRSNGNAIGPRTAEAERFDRQCKIPHT